MSEWTSGRLKTFITSALRGAFRKYPPKYETLKEASVGKKVNKKTGRLAEHFKCAACKQDFPAKDVQVDHIEPCVDPKEGFLNWDVYIKRMFCAKSNLQVLCSECHTEKSNKERATKKESTFLRESHPREYATYRNMISRCYNPNSTGYEYYGGKGIKVCDAWKDSFYNFYTDMGERPEDTSLDRINYNGDYCKENCRWATPIEQGRNTTRNNYIDFDGKLLCISEWGEVTGIKANTILYRLRRGWGVAEALGYKEKNSKIYNGRLSLEDIEDLVKCISEGESQTSYAKRIGMDSSQVCRIYNKFKSAGERKERHGNKKPSDKRRDKIR